VEGAVEPSPVVAAGVVDWAPSVAVPVEEGPVLALVIPFLSSANLVLVLSEKTSERDKGKGHLPPRLGMNIHSLLLTIIIKGPDFLPGRTIQSALKIPHQPSSSTLRLLMNRELFIDSSGSLSNAEFLIDALGGAESSV